MEGLAQPDDAQSSPPLEEVFRRYQPELLGTLYILLGSAQEAQEAFREVFLRCWRHREELGEVEDRKAWIFRAVFQTARQRRAAAWRRRWRLWNWETSEGPEDLGGQESARPSQQDSEQLERYRRALIALAPEEQEVFLLRQNAQMDYPQIAAFLGVPEAVVKVHMARALAHLASLLSAWPLPTHSPSASEQLQELPESEQPPQVLPLPLHSSVALEEQKDFSSSRSVDKREPLE